MTTLKAKTAGSFFGGQGGVGMTTRLPSAAGLLLFGIRFYQAIFAQHMPVGCKFYPSCSHYAAEAIERHGAARGARLALARLWRCRPFTRGGFDPVPDGHEVSSGAAETASHSAHEAEGGARAEVSS
jgi:putative membrane protein insertion efficiency factor